MNTIKGVPLEIRAFPQQTTVTVVLDVDMTAWGLNLTCVTTDTGLCIQFCLVFYYIQMRVT